MPEKILSKRILSLNAQTAGKKWYYLIKHLEKGHRRYQRCCQYRKMSIEIKPQIAVLE